MEFGIISNLNEQILKQLKSDEENYVYYGMKIPTFLFSMYLESLALSCYLDCDPKKF